MLKTGNVQQTIIEGDNSGISDIGVISGDNVSISSNGGKDKLIEKQEEQVHKSYDVLVSELQRFHEANLSKDEYIKKQDDYIARIVRNNYERNERNMARIDNLIIQLNETMKTISEDKQKTREQMDRLLTILEKKL